VWVLSCCHDTWKSIVFVTVGFMGLRCVVPLSVQEKMGLFVGMDQRLFSLWLPSSAHLSASSFRGSPRCAFILMEMVRRPCSIRSRKSCTMSLMMSASGFPHIRGICPPLSISGRRIESMLSLIRGLLDSYPVSFWHLPVLGMLPLIQLCWRSCLPHLYPADSILLCFHLSCSSPPP